MSTAEMTVTAAQAVLWRAALPESAQRLVAAGQHPSLVVELYRESMLSQEVREGLFEALVAAYAGYSRAAMAAACDDIVALCTAVGVDNDALRSYVSYSPHKIGYTPRRIAARLAGMSEREVHEAEWGAGFHRAYSLLGTLLALGTWWVCETLGTRGGSGRRGDLGLLTEQFADTAFAADLLGQILIGAADGH